ncbi:hypothetical protein Leryth_018342 [Lithospermum erythrorhizon]|nr:hypothetical protein Leryth_018342 [Lithospermum erythrorhizon]
MRNQTAIFAASDGEANLTTDIVKKRKVVEHVSLLKAKEDLSEEQEKDMLDFLYTVQYQMRGIVAISLGRVSDENTENYTHAIYMRFQKKEDLARFYDNPFYLRVLREHVMPYCHEIINVDYESEVEDDILPIFRKGEEFNFGLEFILLIEFSKNALSGPAEDALDAFGELITEFPSLIVQATKGSTINVGTTAYTHASIWSSKFQPIIEKSLHAPYSVDPVGTELM